MEDVKMLLTASDVSISQQKQNDVFMYVGMRVASTTANKNNEGVTQAFIDSIIENQNVMYNCLPLYVDLANLKGKRYHSLTHLLDRRTNRFGTTQIGGLCNFYKVNDEYGVSLMAEARIPKRDRDICMAILDLYAMGMLNFSFEIKYDPLKTVTADGVIYIDAAEDNVLVGVAVVSVPAYRESTALSIVAEEHETIDEDKMKGDEPSTEDDCVIKGAENTMTLEEAMTALAEQTSKVEELKKVLDEKESAEKEAETSNKLKNLEQELKTEKESSVTKDETIVQKDKKIEEQTVEIQELKDRLTEFEQIKGELDAIKKAQAEAQMAERKSQLKDFAARMRLDTNDANVAQAISSLNYEALVTMANNISPAQTSEAKEFTTQTAGDSFKLNSRFGDLLDRK